MVRSGSVGYFLNGSAVPYKNRHNIYIAWRLFMNYQWKIPGLYDVSAQDAGAEIESCVNENGYISVSTVVERARSEASAIHGCFEWNDQAAAGKYRLQQAGDLIRNIVSVAVTERDGKETPVRVFVNIAGKNERGYKSIETVIGNPGEYAYLLTCAKKELESFSRKYESLSELSAVMSAIREVLE